MSKVVLYVAIIEVIFDTIQLVSIILNSFIDGRIYLSEIRRFIYESFIPLTPVPLFDLAN